MAQLSLPAGNVQAVGESSIASLKTRPDYAITVGNALTGFVELKAPGKGADPRKFKDPHDRDQWQRLRSLPNLLYTDGNSFSLWQNGELVGAVLTLAGDVETSGAKLAPPSGLLGLFAAFLGWQPVPPRSAKELAQTSARLCRLLRDEVTEQLTLGSDALTSLAEDWRKLLFPDATPERFADGYAQAVTFGLLMARARNIVLGTGLQAVAAELGQTSSLIGAALRLLTENAENQSSLKTALSTLVRVLDVVSWSKISKGNPDAWLYFYEDFLEVYDKKLRKETGSYYTPPEVVSAMTCLVHQALVSPRFGQPGGLSSAAVTVADPATGTGTFMLGILRSIADSVRADEGAGAVPAAIQAALHRLIAFEMQLGPYAVAQLRLFAEVVELTGSAPQTAPRMYVTDTLGDPADDSSWIPSTFAPIARQRRDANRIMRDESITVVLGNPPYKEKAKGAGAWVESGARNSQSAAPLLTWMPPPEWGAGAHSKHLRNLYIYFWRWATWKVFDRGDGRATGSPPVQHPGIVCFITVAGFLNGPGFQKMRSYLRETCDDLWVIDCSPEGHQPESNTRIFQGVQQPVCIVMASRSLAKKAGALALVHFLALPAGRREEKFKALAAIKLDGSQWTPCPPEARAPFLPASTGAWSTFPALDDLFLWNGSGVMPGRTWIIAPDAQTLRDRWKRLVSAATVPEKEELFQPHMRNGLVGDKHVSKIVTKPLAGFHSKPLPVSAETEETLPPVRYAYRSFDRQWIIPDSRLINQSNPELWERRSDQQIYLTALTRTSPSVGPALSCTALVPDLDHYKGSFGGRVYPLYSNAASTASNLNPAILSMLTEALASPVTAEDLFSYLAAVAANSAYTARFQPDLSTPGLRIPLTTDPVLFHRAVALGRRILWLHTFGERLADPAANRPAGPPRLPADRRPTVPADGAISPNPDSMPDLLGYDAGKQRLLVGHGFIDHVTPAMWSFEVSGKQVLTQWFSYRKKNRERPVIGDRRPPSALTKIQPDHWLPEYTTELLNVLNILGLLIDLEPEQSSLLEAICSGPLLSTTERATSQTPKPKAAQKRKSTATLPFQ